MSDSTTITREQLRTVLISTELGGKEGDSSHFSYAGLGKSTYSFGQMQFDVGKGGSQVKGFFKSNGFDNADIEKLSKHGGLSQKELDALDTKLQAIPQATIDRFTNDQLDKTVSGVGDVIDQVRQINPAMADAIAKDPKLQLGIADYQNQFGKVGPQAAGFLAGKSETLSATGIPYKLATHLREKISRRSLVPEVTATILPMPVASKAASNTSIKRWANSA